ncbi:hypothetical protein L0128_22420, partial [candidate division KSB1 bacterium]|nr:hypothetical protein [candidate division KSB1 bacterium]
ISLFFLALALLRLLAHNIRKEFVFVKTRFTEGIRLFYTFLDWTHCCSREFNAEAQSSQRFFLLSHGHHLFSAFSAPLR